MNFLFRNTLLLKINKGYMMIMKVPPLSLSIREFFAYEKLNEFYSIYDC